MQSLDLYASIEEYLDFEEEIKSLYEKIGLEAISKEPKKLIDIGCGQGEFIRALEFNGINCFGVDLSKKQIQIAKAKDLNVKCIDIKDIEEKFDCATAVFDVINYLPNDYVESFFQYTFNLLEDNGYFIFDINSLFGFSEVAVGTLSIDLNSKFINIDANYEDDTLFTNITLFEQKNKCYTKKQGLIKQFYYTNDYLSTLLKKVGFSIEKIDSFNLHNFEEDDKYIFVCKKG